MTKSAFCICGHVKGQKEPHKTNLKIVALSLGVGALRQLDRESQEAARKACKRVMRTFEAGQFVIRGGCKECKMKPRENLIPEAAACELIRIIEDGSLVNCGFNACLTMEGDAECDASMMSDRNNIWTGVGAVTGVKNPILLAKSLYDHQSVPRVLNLVQPNMLASRGAYDWMDEHCPELGCCENKLVSILAHSNHQALAERYPIALKMQEHTRKAIEFNEKQAAREDKNWVEIEGEMCQHCGKFNSKEESKKPKIPECDKKFLMSIPKFEKRILDKPEPELSTIGAIAIDDENNFCVAMSSGGKTFKYKGFLGPAALPGAGCWCEDSIAVATSGVCEYINSNLLARNTYDKLKELRRLTDDKESDGNRGTDCDKKKKSRKQDVKLSCAQIDKTVRGCFEEYFEGRSMREVAPYNRKAGIFALSLFDVKNNTDKAAFVAPEQGEASQEAKHENAEPQSAAAETEPKSPHDKPIYLSYAHTGESMYMAYMVRGQRTATAIVSLADGDPKSEELLLNSGTLRLI